VPVWLGVAAGAVLVVLIVGDLWRRSRPPQPEPGFNPAERDQPIRESEGSWNCTTPRRAGSKAGRKRGDGSQ
jgi:hypothetical protein